MTVEAQVCRKLTGGVLECYTETRSLSKELHLQRKIGKINKIGKSYRAWRS